MPRQWFAWRPALLCHGYGNSRAYVWLRWIWRDDIHYALSRELL